MIQLLRIDGRLIHGMVAVPWCSALKPQTIVIVNQKAADDSFYAMSLKLAKPADIAMLIFSPKEAIVKLQSSKQSSRKVFVIVGNTKDAKYLCEHLDFINEVNLGPTIDDEKGRESEGKHLIIPSIALSDEEYEDIEYIHNKGINLYAQLVPTSPKIEFDTISQKCNS